MAGIQRVPYLILGGGAAAFSAATRADELGVDTVMVNAGLPLGGTCVNVGCVPSKHLLASAHAAHAAAHPGMPGIASGPVQVNYAAMKAARDELVLALRASNYRDVLDALPRVRFVEGHGRFVDPHTVAVGEALWRADHVLVAVGARPARPPIEGLDHPRVADHRKALTWEEVPGRLVVLGAGPQGLEWAQAFRRLGAEVDVVELLPEVLPAFDRDVAAVLRAALEAEGIRFHLGARATRVADRGPVGVRVELPDGAALEATHVLLAAGVVGNADGIDAERAELSPTRRGFLEVDDTLATAVPHIHAAGDVIGRSMLEHAAGREGRLAADNALAGAGRRVDHDQVPAVVYTDPEAALVGLTETEQVKRLGTCRCRTVRFERVPRALAAGVRHGIARLTVDPATDRVVGAQVVGPHAGDAIHEIVVAIRAGLTVDDLVDTVHAFPTFSEAFKHAALAFRRDTSVMSCCIA